MDFCQVAIFLYILSSLICFVFFAQLHQAFFVHFYLFHESVIVIVVFRPFISFLLGKLGFFDLLLAIEVLHFRHIYRPESS